MKPRLLRLFRFCLIHGFHRVNQSPIQFQVGFICSKKEIYDQAKDLRQVVIVSFIDQLIKV